ncbi:transcriptional regulator [Caballeronia sp. EK]|uniref:helix-turn-helix domain-containing protein n=1 Tax=Caballeronia sp. EK TaxID=2767469 RepID=UPI0016555864|nr:helix-turn-helix domain-containing protein [Caballeronia sp. EK]MBC8642111.1 transcriptional regulator [Caballeronia sp. EK]
MRLDDYLRGKRMTQAQFGELLIPPVKQAQVSQWFRGLTRVTLDQALQIERITDGEVTPADCAALFAVQEAA